MIKVEVKEYCESCTEFDPDVEYPTNFYADCEVAYMTDTIVRCKDRHKCENIHRRMKLEEMRKKQHDSD